MDNVNLKKTGWHAMYYRFIFNKELPIAFCDYFWELIAIILLSPIILPFVIVYRFFNFLEKLNGKKEASLSSEKLASKKKIEKIIGKVLIFIAKTIYYGFIGIFIIGLVVLLYQARTKFSWSGFFEIIGTITVFAGLIWLLILGLVRFFTSDFVAICVAKFQSYKEKTCPKINWK